MAKDEEKQFIAVMLLQSKLKGLETKIAEQNTKVQQAASDVQKAEADRTDFLEGKEAAKAVIVKNKELVVLQEKDLKRLKDGLVKSQAEVKEAERVLGIHNEMCDLHQDYMDAQAQLRKLGWDVSVRKIEPQ